MKGAEEIRRVIVEELGLFDLARYRRWVAEDLPKLEIDSTLVARLSPEVVDCRAFWRVCDSLFGFDPVTNVAVEPEVGALPHAVHDAVEANRANLRIAKSFGILSFLEEHAHERLRTFEIGTGYGSLKHYVETNTAHAYVGIDVVPRIPGVIEATAEGFIPDDGLAREEGRIAYVVSTNVFQHLSAKQRLRYYRDAHRLLQPGGLFLFNLTVETSRARLRDRDGNAWSQHYGQFTEIPKAGELHRVLRERFSILYVTQRYDGVFQFVCQKG